MKKPNTHPDRDELDRLRQEYLRAKAKYESAHRAYMTRPRACQRCGEMTDTSYHPGSAWYCFECTQKVMG